MTTENSQNTTLLLQDRCMALRAIPARFPLYRLFRHTGADFAPAPPAKRNGRLDPPSHRCNDYGVLYASDSLMTAAIEVGAMLLAPSDPPIYKVSDFAQVGQMPLQWTKLVSSIQVNFIDLTDTQTAQEFGLNLLNVLDDIGAWRAASAAIFDALDQSAISIDLVGICYRSQRRRNALNYALIKGRYENAFTSMVQGSLDLNALSQSRLK